ncbi:neuronal acetylcholine receptor subunit alpha-7-like, partial [Convolutriloba macropyga]|uniref:neuronal acetylcholine receptor subunit alpha-7-like n=1 Tax=Convolutriloba macropyga TaxID=536237 RepID=UPI003F51F087
VASEKSWDSPVMIKSCCWYTETGRCGLFCPFVIFPYALTEKTRCIFDVTEFPFDRQECHIDIGPWYTSLTMFTREIFGYFGPYHIRHPSGATQMTLSAYESNSQWDVERVSIKEMNRTAYFGEQHVFDQIRYTIHMKRKPTFFINTLVLPCSLLTFLNVLSVILPVESGEKSSLAITIMLAQVVNLLILSSILPTSSEFFPALGRYFLITIALIGLSLIYNCTITNYFFNDFKSIYKTVLK